MTHMLNFVKRHPPELENKIVRNVVKHWETRLKRRGVPSICLDWLYTFTRFVFWILWGLDTLCHAGQEWSTFTLWTRQNEKGKGACCVFGGLLCIARLLYQVEGRFKGAAVCRGFSRLCCTLRQVPISQVQGTELTLACDKHGLHLILLDTWACPSTSTQAISVCGFVGSLHFRSYSGNLAFAHTSAFADLRHWTTLHARTWSWFLSLKMSEVMRIDVPIAISTAIYDCLGAWPSVKVTLSTSSCKAARCPEWGIRSLIQFPCNFGRVRAQHFTSRFLFSLSRSFSTLSLLAARNVRETKTYIKIH